LSGKFNLTEFACGAPLPFANLLKGLRELGVLLQKVIGYPFDPFACGNCDACNAVNVSNIPLGELNFN
jgi:hypothetical protein